MVALLLAACAGPSGPPQDKASDSGVAIDTAETGAPDTGEDSRDTGDTGPPDTTPVDADGDEYLSDVDCNDADPTIHPWARETPYDGIDQDCDGADLVDADGDGHLPPALGGDDCDDFAAGTYPGATEYCDPADEDCYGEPLPTGVCAGVQDGSAMLAQALIAPAYIDPPGWAGDVDGDGVADIQFTCGLHTCDEEGDGGGVMFIPGGRPSRPPTESWRAAAGHWWRDDGNTCSLEGEADGMGDVDGDGHDDAVLRVGGCDWGLYVDEGPIPDDAAVSLLMESDGRWLTPHKEWYDWGRFRIGALNLDGDGRDDTVTSVQDLTTGAVLNVFFGTDIASDGEGEQFFDGIISEGVSFLGDIDGDGLDDFALSNDEETVDIVSGGGVPHADGAELSDIASGTLTLDRSRTPDPSLVGSDVRPMGDLDGDGLPEFVIGGPISDTAGDGYGEVWVFHGALTGAFDQTASIGSWTGSAHLSEFGHDLRTCDFDADGRPDLLASSTGTGTLYLIPGAFGLPGPGTPADEVPHLSFSDGVYDQLDAHLGIDYTGDGIDDLVLLTSDHVLGFIPGWPVPWDDPTLW